MTPERLAKFQRVLNHRQPDLTLIADQVNKPQNLSALIRTADAVGMERIHAVAPKEGYRDYRGTARGSGQWVEVVTHDTYHGAIDAAKAQGMKIYAAHFSDRARDFREFDYTGPCAILMGAEMQGVSDAASELADQHILVPMVGMVGSLNVSVAAGIILSEVQRQRQLAGLYEQRRIDEQTYRDTLFRWCQPQLADYCHRHGLAYPPLDDQGELIEPAAWYRSVR
ncbi:tRNA (guanosine(18)-2'-O)-methyltransferase TrmH [Motiliproteus coralliicola]|uniref:tRNA (guanosine(18)-2'-O)-methyltransferase n=1 Tax=Motiliproteus coralliicola TaxID=2283196 RepID=A0A369WSW4_9GAMM|nr:tRNA (guanosine(18)-2'-O)-methyltransferase TrmH [Motiliproteus coralliicola]RDE25188.1 tRNA (guanosine(18)-2'-O)-methyltransferase TrmH [Motiliproteus coralliicola]